MIVCRKKERTNSQAGADMAMSPVTPATASAPTNTHDNTAFDGPSEKSIPTADSQATKNENVYSDFDDAADGAVGGHI